MMKFPSDPIVDVICRYIGPPQGRRGDGSTRPWWICPFHDDKNPSFSVIPESSRFYCFGCGASGDAIDFVRGLNPGMSYPEARQEIEGCFPRSPVPASGSVAAQGVRPQQECPERWQDFAHALVCDAVAVLWSESGAEARDYLAHRGLHDDTIRAARLGYWPEGKEFKSIFPDRPVFVPSGIVIPWFDGPRITMINVRRAEGDPKYQAVGGSRRGGLYPGSRGIVNGRAVVIVEGEFDALLLGQELRGLATVVTLGGASTRVSPRIKNALLGANPWIVACDADPAGESSANNWLAQSDRCIRIVPPSEFGKDWTEAHQKGLGLRDWWQKVLERIVGRQVHETPALVVPVQKRVPYWPALAAVGYWPIEWRLRWGAAANSYCHQGMPWWEAEARAAQEVSAERDAANGGPPPVMDPDPYTALWRDLLEEFLACGKAAQVLSARELRRAEELLLQTPLDREAMRAVVCGERIRDVDRGLASSGLRWIAGYPRRWTCGNRNCLHKGPWWKSIHGVIRCKNCCPPAFVYLVSEEGDASNAPFVEPTGANECIRPEGVPRRVEPESCPLFDQPGPVNTMPSLSTL